MTSSTVNHVARESVVDHFLQNAYLFDFDLNRFEHKINFSIQYRVFLYCLWTVVLRRVVGHWIEYLMRCSAFL